MSTETFPHPDNKPKGLVSLLMPVYRHEHTIERALDSLLLSDCSAIELIISDDSSPDRTYEVAEAWLESYASRFYSARAVKQPRNLGITGNLNYLAKLATGEFITFFASDDELAPRAIDMQMKYLLDRPAKDFVFANVAVIDPNSRVLCERIVSRRRAMLLTNDTCSVLDMVFNWGPPWSRVFGRRESFTQIGQYIDEHSFEDRWGALKIAQSGRYGYLDTVVQRYRVRGRETATGGIKQERLVREMQDVEERLEQSTTGFLRLCLIVRVRSFNKPGRFKPSRLFWRGLSGAISTGVRLVFGSSVAAISNNT